MKRKGPPPSLPTIPVKVRGKKKGGGRLKPAGGGGVRSAVGAEPTSKVGNQLVYKPPTMKFTWIIENFTRLTMKKHYSDVFIVDDYKWRILIFPKGNNVDNLSVYSDVANASLLPNGWVRDAEFSFIVVDQFNNKHSVRKDTHHQFDDIESDWGFTSFMSLRDLNDSTRGYLVNDTIVIEVEIVVTEKGTSHGSGKEISDLLEEAVELALLDDEAAVAPDKAAPPASIALPDDDDSDLALFESIGITFPVSKKSRIDVLASSATTAKTPTSKRAEILNALSTVVCYLHDVKDLKDVDSSAKPPLAVFKALETLKAQGSGLLPKEKISMISKLSTDIAGTVSRYKVRHDLLQGITTDEKDIEACTKAFEVADATIKTMSTEYWEARQQRDAKRKVSTAAEDEVSRLQAELALAQERASELQSQLTEAEQRRLTSFRACADFKDTVYESARIERERVEQSLELKKAMYAKEKDDLDNAHDFLLNAISCLDTEVEVSL